MKHDKAFASQPPRKKTFVQSLEDANAALDDDKSSSDRYKKAVDELNKTSDREIDRVLMSAS